MSLNTEELLKLILTEMKELTAHFRSEANDEPAKSWTSLLLEEYSMGVDLDGNKLIYGHNFVFNQTDITLPPAIMGVNKSIKPEWKGLRLSIIEYAETVSDKRLVDQIIAWRDIVRGQH